MPDIPPALITAVANEASDAQLVYLFGSVGSRYERPDSDLDVAVLYPRPLTLDQRSDLTSRLERATERTVDLLDLASADPVIRRQVLNTGTLIRIGDAAARHTFEMKTLSEYLDLKIDRRAAEERLISGP